MENHSLSDDPLDCAGAQPTSTGASRVLVCLDRSELSETVLSYPVMLARATAGSLTLMNIVESSGDITSESHDALVWELKCNEARQYMGQLLADPGLSHCNIVVQWSESAQKAANGKNRPQPDLRARRIDDGGRESKVAHVDIPTESGDRGETPSMSPPPRVVMNPRICHWKSSSMKLER